MIKKGACVFIPDMKKFAMVIVEAKDETSRVGFDENDAVWQRDKDLVVIFENCHPKSMEDALAHSVLCIIAKIAGFLWRRIVALERDNKELNKNLERLKEDLAQVTGHHRVH